MGQFSVEKPVLPGSALSGNQQEQLCSTIRLLLQGHCPAQAREIHSAGLILAETFNSAAR
jgi:hypothetical protein